MPQALRNFSIPIGLAALLSLAYSPFGAAAEQPALAANAVAYAAPEGHGIDADKAEQAAIFKKVQGTVVIRPKAAVDGAAGKESTRPVASGDALAVGERVHAGKDAGASLTLSDGTELVLGARSSVVVRSACGALLPGGVSVGTRTSSFRKATSSSKCWSIHWSRAA